MKHIILLMILLTSIAFASEFNDTKKLAEQGDAEAQNNLGVMYNYGNGVPENYEAAVMWYTKAAEQGYDKAQYNLGLGYQDGTGVPQQKSC
mgnify:FL=1